MGDQPVAMSYSEAEELAAVREFVRAHATALGLSRVRADLLMLAVSELTTNTLQHTRGGGRVRLWAEDHQVVCDVVDGGAMRTFGRPMPPADSVRGRGLAIVERVCDEVSVSQGPEGTVVRLRLSL